MADQPTKTDIQAIFKRLRSIPTNKQCFDCGSNNPTWASVTYGVFLCIDCSAVHRSLGVHITFIRSTQLDTSWTWIQLRAMQVGGNANATHFFRQHGCTSTDAQQKYHSRAAELYKGKLHSMATQAMKLHGTKLHIDSPHDPTSPVSKEVDFFDAHTDDFKSDIQESQKLTHTSEPKPIKNGSLSKAENIDPNEGPSVDHALSMSPTQAAAHAEPRKTLIGAKKTGGAKKSKGFGAQRVKTDFKELENKAQMMDKEREEYAKNQAIQEAKTQEEKEKQMASMRLAYQDMSLERKKQEEKLKTADPKKAEQFERLGMGFGGQRGFSHSAMTDMQTINQETPDNDRNSRLEKFSRPARSRNFFEDELDDMGYSGNKKDSYFDNDNSWGSKESSWGTKESSWGSSNKSGSWDIDRFSEKSSFTETVPSKNEDDKSSRSRKTYDYSSSEDAQKKFGNAKSISSDQFFGPRDTDFETKQNLQKFEGSSSISSADLFGGDNSSKNRSYNSGPDLQEIKDGVRQGVTKVAGRISSIASGVMTSLQDKYGN